MAVDILLVPMELDALYLRTDRSVVGAMADFSRMPYYDGVRDINSDIANLSEEILSEPFDPRSLQLKSGIHLHWALPDALTRGYQNQNSKAIEFPPVPNSWLVTRTDKNGILQWVVESDYLHPIGNDLSSSGITYPFRNGQQSQPFRHMGRKLPLSVWLSAKSNATNAEYLPNLTAIGYGEPTFAAFYPNCLSVFGFHDDAPPLDLHGVEYDIIGWYSRPEQDSLKFWALKNAFAKDQISILKEVYKWAVVNHHEMMDLPQQTVCYAHMTFRPETLSDAKPEQKHVAVAIGNTATEALSAYLSAHGRKNPNLADKIPNPQHLEDQLEAVQLVGRLAAREIDIGPKFLEARHNKQFSTIQSGVIWVIRPSIGEPGLANAPAAAQKTKDIPYKLAEQLHKLNMLQQAFDRDREEINCLRKQLFADWYKYMLCAYPPENNRDHSQSMDEVKFFIEEFSLKPLHSRTLRNQELQLQLQQEIKKLKSEVEKLQAHELEPKPGPRYWQPNEPVILLVDDEAGNYQTVKPTPRHGQDGRLNEEGLLECHKRRIAETEPERYFAQIRNFVQELKPKPPIARIGFKQWRHQPWHAFILEWDVEVMPIRGKYAETDNLENASQYPETRNYASDCITANYQFADNAVDHVLSRKQEKFSKENNRYFGRSILTPHAKQQMINLLQLFLEKELLEDYYTVAQVKPEDRTNDYFEKHKDSILSWAENKDSAALRQILAIYQFLNNDDDTGGMQLLAQSLSGFNQALLMQKQTLQLPIDDPLGFADYQAFTAAVREAVAGNNGVAPQPKNDFNPIRTGILKINHLRLVDNFGQIQTLKLQDQRIITTDAMSTPINPHLTVLPPRIVQPARINFRWLSADADLDLDLDLDENVEMNSHPVTSPICGWLLPNHLDNSLMVYDSQGRTLGAITQLGRWQAAPGQQQLRPAWPLPNQHLHQLVGYFTSQGPAFLADFMLVVENALANIDPENTAQHEALALFMGRPIAVVRAAVNLELQGLAAIDQNWSALQQDMERTFSKGSRERETADFTKVEFPIRIGEYKQLNDGLVGYWITSDAMQSAVFYAPQAEPTAGVKHDNIVVHRPNQPIQLSQSLSSPPQTLTMLLDPRGSVHASSGVLPTKAIQIPAEYYAEALRNLEVTFLTAPILTPRDRISLPLPAEAGYAWSWLEKENGAWNSIAQIAPVSDQAQLSGSQELREGWLKLTKTGQPET